MKTRTKWFMALLALGSVAILGLTGCGDKSKASQDLSGNYKQFMSSDKDS